MNLRKGMFAVTAVLCLLAAVLLAEVPHQINFQGTLSDSIGNPITGIRQMVFAIYADSVGETPLWNETLYSVTIDDGLFHVKLGSETPIPPSIFDGNQLWLGITVSPDLNELSPRQSLATVPYGFKAGDADHASEADLADMAIHATYADTATWTLGVGNISHADTADYAFYAEVAIITEYSERADTANFALMADMANNALNANSADFANFSIQAGIANQATFADTAQFAFQSVIAAHADTAIFAIQAGEAALADDATHATNSDTAQYAVSAAPDNDWATSGSNIYRLNGNVGIGTASPTEKLYVMGNMHASGTIKSGSSIVIDGVNETISADTLELHVGSARALRLEPHATSPNIVGGYSGNSIASGVYGATIGGGGSSGVINNVTDIYGTISGGVQNQAGNNNGNTSDVHAATIGGGYWNTATASWATVAGGSTNDATNYCATISGGSDNNASGDHSTIGGGLVNNASGYTATIAGGKDNTSSGAYCTVGGGEYNTASFASSTVGGGYLNYATNIYATVPGGYNNQAGGRYSFAAGRQAKANHNGCFVWADSTNADFTSTAANQFLIRASGGVGIGTSNPDVALQIGSGTHNPIFNNATMQLDFNDTWQHGIEIFNNSGSSRWGISSNADVVIGSQTYGKNLYLEAGDIARASISGTTGNVGIGTLTPSRLLHVYGDANPRILVEAPSGQAPELNLQRGTVTHGLYVNSGNDLVFFQSGDRVTFTDDGKVGVGTINPTHQLTVSSSATDDALRLIGPDGTWGYGARLNFGDGDYVYLDEDTDDHLDIHGGGGITLTGGEVTVQTMNATTSGNQVMWYNGKLYYYGSSEKYKDDIKPLTDNFDKILNAEPVSFTDKVSGERNIGFIAEDFEKMGLENLVVHRDGEPDGVKYELVSVYLLEMVKELKSENQELRQRIESLETQR